MSPSISPTLLIPSSNGTHAASIPPEDARGVRVRPAADPTKEYVSARPNPQIARYVESLPQWIDDITRDFGTDLYDRMLNDSQVYSCVEILKLTVMSEGWEVVSAVEDKKEEGYNFAKQMADFCKKNLEGMDKPFEQFIYEMLDALALGNKLAEKVCRIETIGEFKGRLVLDYLKVKPRKTYSFVVDAFWNILGIIAVIPGRSYIIYQGQGLFSPEKSHNILPREKFCILTHNPQDNDPRGRSVLRPAYDPWWCKLQMKGEYLKYLAQFGSPSLWGVTSESATPEDLATFDSDGNPTGKVSVSPEQKMVNALRSLRNGSVAAFPFGSSVNVLSAAQGGSFSEAFTFYDKQITKSILGQTLATEEGEHQARAAAETHQDILDLPMKAVRRSAESMVRNDLFRYLVQHNFGEEAARRYTPHLRFGKKEDEQKVDIQGMTALASAQLLVPSQLAWFYEKIGIPIPKQGEQTGFEKSMQQPSPDALRNAAKSTGDANAPQTDQTASPAQSPAGGVSQASFARPEIIPDRQYSDPCWQSRKAYLSDVEMKRAKAVARSFASRKLQRLFDSGPIPSSPEGERSLLAIQPEVAAGGVSL